MSPNNLCFQSECINVSVKVQAFKITWLLLADKDLEKFYPVTPSRVPEHKHRSKH